MQRGQAALEYLITYGWAILIILVVLGVLWYYGIFNPSMWAGEQVVGYSAFQVLDKKLEQTSAEKGEGEFSLILGNKLSNRINITGVNITGSIKGSTPANFSEILNSGSRTSIIKMNITGLYGAIGDLIDFDLTIYYDDLTTGLTDKKDPGEMKVKIT